MKNNILVIIFLFSCHIVMGQVSCEEVNNSVKTLNQEILIVEPVFDGNFAPPPPPPPPPGDQLIYFVHGLGGDASTWAIAANEAQSAYQTTALRPLYSEYTLSGAGIDLHNSLVEKGTPHLALNSIEDPATSFLIGSSQGGIVARAANKYYSDVPAAEVDRMFGGIVTFGSAHQGARIINNIPVLQQMLEEGCGDVGAAYALGAVPRIVLPLVNLTDLEEQLDKICGSVTGLIETFVFGKFLAPITEEYAVGTPELEVLNAFSETSNIPKVAFYGVEEEPIFWRTMNYFVTDPNSLPLYGANEDDALMMRADSLISNIEANHAAAVAAYENAQGLECDWWQWIVNPVGCAIFDLLIDEEDLRRQRDTWNEGLDYMLTLNKQYKIAIGALDFELQPENIECTCTEYDTGGPTGNSNTFIVGSNEQCLQNSEPFVSCTPRINYTLQLVEHPSDGVVLASSAGDMPGGIVRPNLDREMKKTSHQQQRNNSELEVKLTNLFAGGVNEFFIIPSR